MNEAGETSKEILIINRDDFWTSASNKQLNFLQQIFAILGQYGRAALVLNVQLGKFDKLSVKNHNFFNLPLTTGGDGNDQVRFG